MEQIEWKDFFLTNIPEIDIQHKKLVEILNKVIAAKNENKIEEIKEIFIQLIQYTQYHFEFEENHMQFNRYDKLAEHKEQHQFFVKQIQQLLINLKAGNISIFDELQSMLEHWLIDHICTQDRNYARIIKKVKD